MNGSRVELALGVERVVVQVIRASLLASPAAEWITERALGVDGGLRLV